MTIAGILSGFADPLSGVRALPRGAARLAPVRAVEAPPGRRPRDDASGAVDPTASRFQTQDVVELSGPHDEPDLTEEEQARLQELKARDREVRQHEAAHLAAAGPYARGAANFTYETGPDGQRYAASGEVQIDTSPVSDDPEASLRKMEQVRAAALAPAEPSAQDRQVAAQATARTQQARARLGEQGAEQRPDAWSMPPDAASSAPANALDQPNAYRPGELIDELA